MIIKGNESATPSDQRNTGLTIRQEIAARALGAIISGAYSNNTAVSPKEAAKLAFDFAEGFINENNSREHTVSIS